MYLYFVSSIEMMECFLGWVYKRIIYITFGRVVGLVCAVMSSSHCGCDNPDSIPVCSTFNISNPDFAVVDQLSRMSHDPDAEISQNSILDMGLTSTGMKNPRGVGSLHQLCKFYSQKADW